MPYLRRSAHAKRASLCLELELIDWLRRTALRENECALAAQVQARTQQRAAEGRQSRHLLESAHGSGIYQ
jgi:hypothetical protein